MSIYTSDFLVIGSGLSGLFTAHKLASIGTVNIVTKRDIGSSNTELAQGGIASVIDPSDSFENHIEDTINTGSGLSDPYIVRITVQEGHERIKELIELGVNFTRNGNSFDLGLEGGHSKRRIMHAGDFTGREIESALIKACGSNPKIKIFERHIAVDLICGFHPSQTRPENNACSGCYVLDEKTGEIHSFMAGKTVLASGGAGKVYLYTSNPDTATGDGMAMAYRAGLRLVNMEFVQFHPTCLYHHKAKSFLISEALRGEGAVLRLADGTPFMRKYSVEKELAPRDIVARAIDFELKKTGDECVYLDITRLNPGFIRKRFPNIHQKCSSMGIDITIDPIPVVPAAHFFCGGVEADEWSRTAMNGLYAVGEAAHTGLHGANRLASNSLLECCVFSHRAYLAIKQDTSAIKEHKKTEIWNTGNAKSGDEAVIISHNWDEIRALMWNYVGIVRSDKRLERAERRMKIISEEILKYYWDFYLTRDILELRNIACLAEQIIKSAQSRKESRALHFNINYPDSSPEYAKNTVVDRYS